MSMPTPFNSTTPGGQGLIGPQGYQMPSNAWDAMAKLIQGLLGQYNVPGVSPSQITGQTLSSAGGALPRTSRPVQAGNWSFMNAPGANNFWKGRW